VHDAGMGRVRVKKRGKTQIKQPAESSPLKRVPAARAHASGQGDSALRVHDSPKISSIPSR